MSRPVVLSLSGHDPTGGAGIHADIESISAMGAHAASVITCLTVQDTHNVYSVEPLNIDFILQQAKVVLADMDVSAFKIGLLGSCEIVEGVSSLLDEYPHIPVILDPVLAAGGGAPLAKQQLISSIKKNLLANVSLVTPNVPEADALSIFESDCKSVLLTGTHDASTTDVINKLFVQGTLVSTLSWPRLDGVYHGSGCTLAAAVAAGVAKGLGLKEAVEQAQQFSWRSLSNAQALGKGQLIPFRV